MRVYMCIFWVLVNSNELNTGMHGGFGISGCAHCFSNLGCSYLRSLNSLLFFTWLAEKIERVRHRLCG